MAREKNSIGKNCCKAFALPAPKDLYLALTLNA
jgi:hypothetical protein